MYPSDPTLLARVRSRSGGQLSLFPDGEDLLLPPPLRERLGTVPGWWLGLGLLLTLFAREHNAVCDRLAAEYPDWSDEQLFQKARLVVAALMAKIHTVEWTPAIIAHPTTRYAMATNWWGAGGRTLHPLFERLFGGEILTGIPGT